MNCKDCIHYMACGNLTFHYETDGQSIRFYGSYDNWYKSKAYGCLQYKEKEEEKT